MERVSLPNEFLEGTNNVYVLEGPETGLIDAGSDTPTIRSHLKDGLAAIGLDVAAVDRIYVTHYDVDHCGGLGWLVQESGADVYAHPAEHDLMRGDEAAWADLRMQRREALSTWGVPAPRVDELFEELTVGPDVYEDVSVEPLTGGTSLDGLSEPVETVHTPGHTKGHLAYTLPRRNEIVTGDALLPVYTPNVGGADVRVDGPLAEYLRTLRRIAVGGFEKAWPGHRDPITTPTERANAIISHHERRAMLVLRALERQGPSTPWAVSQELFGSLKGIHILHGPGEAFAHLDHLTSEGTIERHDQRYRLTDDAADWLATTERDTWDLGV
jgi:glyoxylase-like metal-dependent hydrolase (beta-lactamase superfamily II)